MPGIYYGYRKKHEMTDIKTLVRKLLAGKLPQKEMPELWQRHDVTQYMQREWDRCAKPAEDDLLRESRIWERIVARTMPHEKIRRRGGVRTAWLSRSYGAAASIMLAIVQDSPSSTCCGVPLRKSSTPCTAGTKAPNR